MVENTTSTWHLLLERLPREKAPREDFFWQQVEEHLRVCRDASVPQPARSQSAHRLVNLFRAAVALLMRANSPFYPFLAFYEGITSLLYRQGQFASWSDLTLLDFPREELDQVVQLAEKLAAPPDGPDADPITASRQAAGSLADPE